MSERYTLSEENLDEIAQSGELPPELVREWRDGVGGAGRRSGAGGGGAIPHRDGTGDCCCCLLPPTSLWFPVEPSRVAAASFWLRQSQ